MNISARLAPLWRGRHFWRLWVGQTASIFGDRVTDIALPFLILYQTHSVIDAGFIAAARYVPMVLFGLPAGVIADRVNRRWLLIGCDLVRALALGIIVAIGVTRHSVPLWLLTIVVIILGVGQLGFQAAYWAWLPDVTNEELLGNATAALEASDAVSTLTGPALGGVLIQFVGSAIALGADAISYLVSAATLASIHSAAPAAVVPKEPRAAQSLWSEALEGVRIILRSPEQRLLKGIGTALYASTGSITILLATLTNLRLHLPPWQSGLVYAGAGIGGLIGSALAPRVMRLNWRRGLAITLAIAALGCAGLAVATLQTAPLGGFVIALLANLVLDGAIALSFIITGTTSVLITPPEVRGRVNAVGSLYSAAIRGIGLIATTLLAASKNPLLAFVVLATFFSAAALAAQRHTS